MDALFRVFSLFSILLFSFRYFLFLFKGLWKVKERFTNTEYFNTKLKKYNKN